MARKKKSAPGLSFRQAWMLAWLLPLIGVLLLLRQANLERQARQAPSWNALEKVRVADASNPSATSGAASAKPSPTAPLVLERPVMSGEPAAAALPGGVPADGATLTEKVSPYENADFGYGFQMPYGVFWQGFGARDGAAHSVGVSYAGLPASFESSDVKVWYYPDRDVPVEGHAGLFQDPRTGKTYLTVRNGKERGPGTDLFVIQSAAFDDRILGKIVASVYLK